MVDHVAVYMAADGICAGRPEWRPRPPNVELS